MGNTVTHYTLNDPPQLRIDTFTADNSSDIPVYSFTLVDVQIQNSSGVAPGSDLQITTYNDWVQTAIQGTSGSDHWDITFQYKPSGVDTADAFNDVKVASFTSQRPLVATGDESFVSDNGTIVEWTNDTTYTTYPYSQPYNSNGLTVNSDSLGGGDPQIIPLINPNRKVYMLNTNDEVHNYLTLIDKDEKIVCNTKMIMLSNAFLQHLQKQKGKECYSYEKNNVFSYIKTKETQDELDNSFVKYLYLRYEKVGQDTFELIFDMDTLELLDIVKDDQLVNSYGLENKLDDTVYPENISVSDMVKNNRALRYLGKLKYGKRNSFKREITVKTQNHKVKLELVIEPEHPNHRNSIVVSISNHQDLTADQCFGAIYDIKTTMILPSLFSSPDPTQVKHNYECMDLEEFRKYRSRVTRQRIARGARQYHRKYINAVKDADKKEDKELLERQYIYSKEQMHVVLDDPNLGMCWATVKGLAEARDKDGNKLCDRPCLTLKIAKWDDDYKAVWDTCRGKNIDFYVNIK